MGQGLSKILQLYGSLKVKSGDNEVSYVWDYAQNKSRLKGEMTQEEWEASEKARWTQSPKTKPNTDEIKNL